MQGDVDDRGGCALDPAEVEAQLGSGVVGEPGGRDGHRGGGCDGGCGRGAAGRRSGDRAHQGALRRVVASAVSARGDPVVAGIEGAAVRDQDEPVAARSSEPAQRADTRLGLVVAGDRGEHLACPAWWGRDVAGEQRPST